MMPEQSKNEKRSNQSLFEHIHGRYVKPVYRYLYQRVGKSRDIAEDLLQETFLRAWVHVPKLKKKSAYALAYLLRIAKNLLTSYYRKKQPIPMAELPDLPIDTELVATIESRFDQEKIWAKIQELPETEQRVLTLKYKDDMKIKHIAKAMHRSENAVKILLFRARKALGERLGDSRIELSETFLSRKR
jgi:RNA polymerase sigma-70 factor (ECF subfamily)